jgi:hypothetical protein
MFSLVSASFAHTSSYVDDWFNNLIFTWLRLSLKGLILL